MLRFACPACNAVMNSPDGTAGVKVACPKCGQRLQIPAPPKGTILAKPLPPKRPSADKTGLAVHPSSVDPPQSSAPVHPQSESPAETETAHVYDYPRPPSKWMGRVVLSAILLGLVLAAGWVSLLAFRRVVNSEATADEKQHTAGRSATNDEKQLVLDYLQKNLNDPTSMEVVEWGPPKAVFVRERRPPLEEALEVAKLEQQKPDRSHAVKPSELPELPTKPGVVLYARYRAKNAFGARTLTECMFLIQNGKATKSAQFDDWELASYGHDAAIRSAMAALGATDCNYP
jgi:phage FluMu protein Com